MKEITCIKERYLSGDATVCRKCDTSRISKIMEVLFRIESQETEPSELDVVTKLVIDSYTEETRIKNKMM